MEHGCLQQSGGEAKLWKFHFPAPLPLQRGGCFVHEESLENRFPHNAQLERDISTLEEIARSSHLSAGIEMIPDLWMHSANYAATVLNAFQVPVGKEETRHRLATGHDFDGRKFLLGHLVHYRVDPSQRGKFYASSRPGLFTGYIYDSGPQSYKNVFFVLDYQRLKPRGSKVLKMENSGLYCRYRVFFFRMVL